MANNDQVDGVLVGVSQSLARRQQISRTMQVTHFPPGALVRPRHFS